MEQWLIVTDAGERAQHFGVGAQAGERRGALDDLG